MASFKEGFERLRKEALGTKRLSSVSATAKCVPVLKVSRR